MGECCHTLYIVVHCGVALQVSLSEFVKVFCEPVTWF